MFHANRLLPFLKSWIFFLPPVASSFRLETSHFENPPLLDEEWKFLCARDSIIAPAGSMRQSMALTHKNYTCSNALFTVNFRRLASARGSFILSSTAVIKTTPSPVTFAHLVREVYLDS